MHDYTQNNCYKRSLYAIKMNFGRALATMLLFLSCLLMVLTLGKLVCNIFKIELRPITENITTLILGAIYIFAAIIFFLFPIMLGIKKWFYELDGDEQRTMTVIFDYFRNFGEYKKAVSFQSNVCLKKLVVFTICIVPIIGLRLLANYLSQIKGVMGGVLFGVLLLVQIAAIIFFALMAIYINLKFFLAPFLLFQSPLEKTTVLCERSIKIMQTSKQEVGNIYISLCPFYILSILVLPILFLIPYMQLLTSAKAKEIIKKYNSENRF